MGTNKVRKYRRKLPIHSLCLLWLAFTIVKCTWRTVAQLISETYETCSAIEGNIANCGPGANCFLIGGIPTCHCVVDVATGLPLAGNPYKACTWDISGSWQLYTYNDEDNGLSRALVSPVTNQPFIIRLDRTDAILRTQYMLGAIFVVTALTGFAVGVCGRVFLDAMDNTSILFEHMEGFVDQNGRSIMLRSAVADKTVVKVKQKAFDRIDLKGEWQLSDGANVRIMELKKPFHWPNYFSEMTRHWSSYWYNDSSFSSPILRLSMALFMDKTLCQEKIAFHTSARFVQVGWYGALRFGSSRIDIYSPADGKKIFQFRRVVNQLPMELNSLSAMLQTTQTDSVEIPPPGASQTSSEGKQLPDEQAGVASQSTVSRQTTGQNQNPLNIAQDILSGIA